MANASVEINKKHCIKCDGMKSSGGLFTCDGCQQMFCLRHVNEHRQELNLQLDSAMQEHDLIQQESSRLTLNQSILKKIDAWEKQSIIKVQEAAETTRVDFRQWYQSTDDRIKKECGELARSLRSARETDDYSESDLTKWNQILDKLRRYLESMTKVDITEDRQSCVSRIKVQHDIPWITDASCQKDPVVSRRKLITRITDRTGANRSDNVDSQTPLQYRRPGQTEPHNDNNQVASCKQQ